MRAARTINCGYRFGALMLAIAVGAFTAGCGSSGPEMARVTGRVTYNGQPVPLGTIAFQALDAEDGRNAVGMIQPDGTYTLHTERPGDGALLGDYQVGIVARDDPILDYIPAKPIPPKRLTPEKYENPQTSGLRAQIESGRNVIDFELTD